MENSVGNGKIFVMAGIIRQVLAPSILFSHVCIICPLLASILSLGSSSSLGSLSFSSSLGFVQPSTLCPFHRYWGISRLSQGGIFSFGLLVLEGLFLHIIFPFFE